MVRYKQLYNALTHSEAFGKKGGYEGSKINKNTFTPHNLRTLLIGANGAIAVYYTTNKLEQYKVRFIDIRSGIISPNGAIIPEKYQEALKEEKGMVDALYLSQGLKFNYVEEIIFFGGGFENPNGDNALLDKESQALLRFATNGNIRNSLKRLKGIYVVNAPLCKDFKDDSGNVFKYHNIIKADGEDVSIQLEKAGFPIASIIELDKTIQPFNPKRTELGLLLNDGLDGKEYVMDTKYTPDIDEKEGNKEQYRLSKHFYKEKQRALAEKKKIEAEKAENEKLNAVMEDVNSLWRDVKPIYEELYRSAIENGCVGILVPNGIKAYTKDQKTGEKKIEIVSNKWVKAISQSFFDFGGSGFEFKSTSIFKTLELKDLRENNYFEQFHAFNAFGIKDINKITDRTRKWDVMLPIIEERFKTIAKQFLINSKIEDSISVYNEIKTKLTNCIVIEKVNRETIISMKYKMQGINIGYNQFLADNSKKIFSQENCKILNSNVSQYMVNTLFGVFDAKKFAAEALFSYQAYEDLMKAGRKVGLQNTIMGRNLDGTPNIYNLAGNDARLTGLFAGSGSGKGVMTLGLLSSIVTNNVPFIYLDYKPDMAEMLWDIEREFNSQGITRTDGKPCRILAIDSKADLNDCSPIRGHYFGENAPDYLSSVPSSVYAVVPYLKLMQLYYLLASIRKQTENQAEFGGKMTYAIFDELQQNILDNLANLVDTMKIEVDTAKKTKNENYDNMFKYQTKLLDFINKLANQTGTFVNTDGRVANSRALYIGQDCNFDSWCKNKITKNLYQKTSTRFFGRNGGSGSYAPSNSGVISEFVNNKNTFGYWTVATGAGKVEDKKDWQVFKAYSVLNVNDFDMDDPSSSGRCTAGVLNNINDESVREDLINNVFVMDDGNGGKVIRPEVGFLGLIKKLSQFTDNQLADALSEGYEVIWKVMCKYGMNNIYPDIETYLFDCSYESILTVDEIKSGRFLNAVQEEDPTDSIRIFDDEDFNIKNENQPFSPQQSNSTSANSQQNQNNTSNMGANKNGNPVFNPTRPQRPNQQGQSQPINANTQAYRGNIEVRDNPFTKYTNGTNTDTLLTVKEMTQILMKDIKQNVCPDNMITSFFIQNGTLIINDISYQPTFDNEFMNSLPQSLKMKVENGQMAEFYDLRQVYKYGNLERFGILDENLAQGRARKEMAIGFKKRWSVLFNKFDRLQFIQVGSITYNRENPDTNVEESLLDKFKNNPALTYASGSNSGIMDKVWDSRPVRAIVRGLGWTMGVQTVWFAASLMGPWGLLFGAVAAASVYNDTKKRNQMNNPNGYKVNTTNNTTTNNTNTSSTTTTKQNKSK